MAGADDRRRISRFDVATPRCECSDSSVDDAFNHTLREKGRIDVLVNNAGIGARGAIELTPVAVFRQVMETNFFGGLR